MNVKSWMDCRILYVSYSGFLFMIVEITATLELDHSHVVEKFVMYMPQIETDQRRKDDIVKPHG